MRNPADCPAERPADGSACDAALSCDFVVDAARQRCVCDGGPWQCDAIGAQWNCQPPR